MSTAGSSLPATTRVGRVSLRVGDLDRMVEFYRDVVGLAVRHHGTETATLGAGDEPLLELSSAPDAPARGRDETGLFHAAFRVPTRHALADALKRVRDRWQLDGASDHLVSEALYFDDPEGNGVELYRDRPEDDWPFTDDGGVEMKTLPLDLDDLRATGSSGVDGTVPDETTVGHVHLEVSSLAAAERFYVDGLGLGVRTRYGEDAVFVAAGTYHHHVGLNTWNGRTAPPSGRGLAWFELVVPTAAVLDDATSRLDRAGADVIERDTGVMVSDPDGIDVRVRSGE